MDELSHSGRKEFNHLLGLEHAILASFAKKFTRRNWILTRNLRKPGAVGYRKELECTEYHPQGLWPS